MHVTNQAYFKANLFGSKAFLVSPCSNAELGSRMFSRSSQQVLARFSSDEMRHVRNRRGTAEETSQAFLDAVLSIERAQRKLADPDIDEDERE